MRIIILFTLAIFSTLFLAANHPFYVSVTNIEHNEKAQSLEITSKVFPDDFENALKNEFGVPVNILMPLNKNETDSLVKKYFKKHFSIKADDADVLLNYLGYEKEEEGVIMYFEATGIRKFKKLTVFMDVLYKEHAEQAQIIRSKANGVEKNTRMVNPVNQAILYY